MCETELLRHGYKLYNESCCVRIGPRCAISCANILTRDGRTLGLSWVSGLRYLGIVTSCNFKCSSLSNAKRSFYSAVNAIFSKVLNFGTEEVILELITTRLNVCSIAHTLIRPSIVPIK